MADDVDRANEYAEREREAALAKLLQPDQRSPRTHCAECGVPIGESRLSIVPKAQHCIDCAHALEQKQRHHR